jgi:hypothetical protein
MDLSKKIQLTIHGRYSRVFAMYVYESILNFLHALQLMEMALKIN